MDYNYRGATTCTLTLAQFHSASDDSSSLCHQNVREEYSLFGILLLLPRPADSLSSTLAIGSRSIFSASAIDIKAPDSRAPIPVGITRVVIELITDETGRLLLSASRSSHCVSGSLSSGCGTELAGSLCAPGVVSSS